MPRLETSSKYCVLRRSSASASSKVWAKLMPSIGFCVTPFSVAGGVMPITS
jgi:hypothetical protein